MSIAALMGDDGSFTQVQVVSSKSGWSTIVDTDGATRKVRNSKLADWSDDAVEAVLTDSQGFVLGWNDEDDGGDGAAPRRGNVFPPAIRATYVKGVAANGKAFIDCDDDIADSLRGMEVEQVALVASQVIGHTPAYWISFYTTEREAAGKVALNAGMIRMNLGNRIRAAHARTAEEVAEFARPEQAV